MSDATRTPVTVGPPRPAGGEPVAAGAPRFVAASRTRPRVPLRAITPPLVLAAALALSLAASLLVFRVGRARDHARFQNAMQSTADRITARLESYVTLLVSGAAYVSASDSVNADEFHAYVALLDVERRYPGTLGVGYTRRLAGDGERLAPAERVRRVRAGGSAARDAWPLTPRDEWHAIVFLEPLDVRNRAALGFDMSTEATRREAMHRARDTGRPAASGPVVLVQEITPTKQIGFAVYAPAYTKGPVPRTVDERRRRLRGYFYAPFRVDDLFAGIFGSERQPRVAFRVFDGRDTTGARLLFDSHVITPDGHVREGPVRALQTIDAAGRPWTIAFTPRNPAGATSDAIAFGIALFGLAVGLVLFHVTRAEMRARAAAERSEAIRARFFAAMSHELRTPVNAIMGYNDLMLAGVHGPLSPALAHGVERSQRAARHLLELVNDVLDLSKLEAGKVDILVEEVRLDALIDDLLATIRPMADERGCTLELDAGECAELHLRTDPRRLRQILLNLLSNATKFAPGKPVRVRCHALPRDWLAQLGFRAADAVAIDVTDRGPGIAAADQERIFEEFVQLPSAVTGGTGLGLAISRRLAELLGGGLVLESELGRGSTFRIVLPLAGPFTAVGRGS